MNDDTALILPVDLDFYGVGMTPTALVLPPDLSFKDGWTLDKFPKSHIITGVGAQRFFYWLQ